MRKPFGFVWILLVSVLLSNLVASAQVEFGEMPGEAIDLGIGANGSVWMIGRDFKAYHFTDSEGWLGIESADLRRIAVDPEGNPWVINKNFAMFRLVNDQWQSIPGQARGIGIGADGSVYHIGLSNTLYKWDGTNWGEGFGADAREVAVDPEGNPWTVTTKGEMNRYMNGKKEFLPGKALDIDISSNGVVHVIGNDGHKIWRWTGTEWENSSILEPRVARIAVGADDTPWVVANDFKIFRSLPNPDQFDPNAGYRLQNLFNGGTKCFDVVNNGKNDQLNMVDCGAFSGQVWTLSSSEVAGYYHLTNKFTGDNKCLDVVNDGTNNQINLSDCGSFSGQSWRLTRINIGTGYRLHSLFTGLRKCLDVVNDGKNDKLFLNDCGSYSGQSWSLKMQP